MKKNNAFYNVESAHYSAKRYPTDAKTFTQFFFKERLSLVLKQTKRMFLGMSQARLLEVGCADGVVLQTIYSHSCNNIGSAMGIDQSPGMIEVARARNTHPQITFAVRDPHNTLPGSQDVILEIGVLNYLDIDAELPTIQAALAPDGRYICSISGKDSSLNVFHPYGTTFEHLRAYAEYERLLRQYFQLEQAIPVGLFIPLLWKLPFAAALQSYIDMLFRKLMPNLYSEKIYVLRHHTV